MSAGEPQHIHFEANGVRLHVATLGEGPLVLLCHGWPETWRSWRRQMEALAAAGFRAAAPDMRGYGESDAPAPVEAYTLLHLVGDMVAALDALGAEQAVIVGHDWGAWVAWHAALLRPDRFRAVAGLSVPYQPRGPIDFVEALRRAGERRFYILHFQQEGAPEAELEQDVAATLRRMYYSASGEPPEAERWNPRLPEGGGFLATTTDSGRLPDWLAPEDFDASVAAFRKSGFRGGLNWYRNLARNWALLAPWAGATIRQPALFIAGERDAVVGWSRKAIERLPKTLPDLRGLHLILGAGHWVQQERPEEVNAALLAFLRGL